MSKDPGPTDNLANLRRTLPGLGLGDGRPVPLQEVSPSEIETALAASGRPAAAGVSGEQPASVVPEAGLRASSPAMQMLRGTGNSASPMLRGNTNPAMQGLRGTGNSASPMLRGNTNPAMQLLRETGNPATSMLRGSSNPAMPALQLSQTSQPSVPPPANRLPFLIVGLGALAVVIGVFAWLHPGGSTAPAPRSTRPVVAPTRPPVRDEGLQVAVPVRTVAPTALVAVVKTAPDRAASDEKPARPAPRKPVDAPAAVGTTSKPQTGSATVGPTATDKPAPRKTEARPSKVAALDLSPVPQLTPQILRQHMQVAEPRWQSCPKDASGKNLSIGIVVAPSGSVVKADVLGPAGSSETARCITERIRKMNFPAYAEGGPKTFFWSYQAP